ncbi:telomere-associated protein Tap [Streptacidiphilus sp. PAMC 29251]
MSDQPASPFDGVDALLAAVASGQILPPPAERARLREAAGLTQAAVAQALGVRVPSLQAWEEGRSEPAEPRREAYRRLLDGLAARYPAPSPSPSPHGSALAHGSAPASAPAPGPTSPQAPAAAAAPPHPAQPPHPRPVADRRIVPRRGVEAPRAAAAEADPRFAHGPLLVLDGDGSAYGLGGLVLDCPAKTVPALVEWTLATAQLGSPRLHPSGKEGDPLVVLTASAAERLGLPPALEDRAGLRLPDNHPVVKQLLKAKWQLPKRGFGPWPRIYRPATGGLRRCVQLAVLPWGALDARTWGGADQLPAPELAKLLTDFATRVITPRGAMAVTGQELMSALRPPTRAVRDEQGVWRPGPMPGSLVLAVDPAPPEAPIKHPLVAPLYPRAHKPTPDEFLFEEAYEWIRDAEQLTDAECALPMCVGLDVNMAFAAATNRLTVGLGEAVHVPRPRGFDKKLPGSWLYDLSAIRLDPRLPSPFTPHGDTPTGPAWYATPTIAYAHELVDTLGLRVELLPLEAWVRPNAQQLGQLGVPVPPAPWEGGDLAQLTRLGLAERSPDRSADPSPEREAFLRTVPRFDNGAYLDPWYTRLRDAYLATMAELGVTSDLAPPAFLAAMERHKQVDPAQAALLSAIKAVVKGGVGKLREGPQGASHAPGDPWPALARPLWRPDIRAAIISAARVNMHRKMLSWAVKADLWPIAVLSDCAVYASAGPSPLDFMPFTEDRKPLPGGFRLGVSPGMVKLEGTQTFLWAAQLLDQGLNPARHIKGGDAVADGE